MAFTPVISEHPSSLPSSRPEGQVKADETHPEDATTFGHELRELLSPVTPETFSTQYWCRKPLFIKGNADKLQKLIPGGFGRQDFDRAVRKATEQKVKGFRLLARKHEGLATVNQKLPPPYVMIEPDQIDWLLASGANISASAILDPRLARLAAAVKTQLHHPADIHVIATLSTQGNGWPPHIDATSSLLVQCQGSKRFRVSPKPVAPWPRNYSLLTVEGTVGRFANDFDPNDEIEPIDLGELIDYTMEPGDVLFIPPGAVHATEALSESTLTVGLMCQSANFFDFLSGLLEDMLLGDPNWRHFPPIDCSRADPGKLPAEMPSFFSSRLAELRQLIDRLTPTSEELHRHWQQRVADPGESVLASFSPGPATDGRPVEKGDRLRLSSKAPITYALCTDNEGEARLDLFCADKAVSVSGFWVPFLKNMVGQARFAAETATGWAEGGEAYPWESVRDYLQALVDEGILERE